MTRIVDCSNMKKMYTGVIGKPKKSPAAKKPVGKKKTKRV